MNEKIVKRFADSVPIYENNYPMKYRWYLKHNGIIKRVIKWLTINFDDGSKMHRITLDDGTFQNSCDDNFNLIEPTVLELLTYRASLNAL